MQISAGCTSGCMCPDGLVSDGAGGCINETLCPCSYNGQLYQPGATVTVGCNTWLAHLHHHCCSTLSRNMPCNGQNKRYDNTVASLWKREQDVLLLGFSTAIAANEGLCVPAMSAMQFVGFMEMVITSHLMTRGLTLMDCVNTHLYRYVYDE